MILDVDVDISEVETVVDLIQRVDVDVSENEVRVVVDLIRKKWGPKCRGV